MAKQQTKKKKTLAEKAIEPIIELRQRDRRIEELKGELARSKIKHLSAESELAEVHKHLDTLTKTRDKIATSKLSRLKKKRGGSATAVFCMNDWHVEETYSQLP